MSAGGGEITTVTPEFLVDEIRTRATPHARFLVGIAGPPGSGKSHLAADLASQLGQGAAVLPMDGFHLDNDHLKSVGLLQRKGAPETFDAIGFAALLHDVRNKETVLYPTFDRDADRCVPDAGRIAADTNIVLVEGNYLLLNAPPWSNLGGLFDLTVLLKVDHRELEKRLIARWIDQGHTPEQARARALGNDMKNVEFVVANSHPADYAVRTQN